MANSYINFNIDWMDGTTGQYEYFKYCDDYYVSVPSMIVFTFYNSVADAHAFLIDDSNESVYLGDGFRRVAPVSINPGTYYGSANPTCVIRTQRVQRLGQNDLGNRLGFKINNDDNYIKNYISYKTVNKDYIPEPYQYSKITVKANSVAAPLELSIQPKFVSKLTIVHGLNHDFRFLDFNGEVRGVVKQELLGDIYIDFVDVVDGEYAGYACCYIDLGLATYPEREEGNSYFLLNYADKGVVTINGSPAYLKDRTHNGTAWVAIPGVCLAVAYDVTTSAIKTRIKSNHANGFIGFGTSNDSTSLFYNNDTAPSDSAEKTVYIPTDSAVPVRALAGEGAAFKGWVKDGSLALSSTSNVIIQSVTESVDYTALFTSHNGIKAVALLIEGDGTAEIYRDGNSVGESVYGFDDGSVTIKSVKADATPPTYFAGLYDADGKVTTEEEYEISADSIPDNGTKLLKAVFREAEALSLVIGTASGGYISVGSSAGQDAQGRYYECRMGFTVYADNGKELAGYKINNGNVIAASGSSFSIDFCRDIAVDGTVTITPVFKDAVYEIVTSLDGASRDRGGSIAVEYDDITYEGTDISVPMTIGTPFSVKITPNVGQTNGNVVSRVMMYSDEETDETDRFTESGGVYTGIFSASKAFILKVFLGAEASVAAKTVDPSTPATGEVGISNSIDGEFSASTEFEYGKKVYLRATNDDETAETTGTFWSWHDSSDTSFVNPIQGLSATGEFTPSKATDFVALFGGSARESFVCLTNNEQLYGSLSLTEIIPNTVTRYDTYDEFCAAIATTNPHIIPLNPSSAGAVRPGEGEAGTLFAQDSGDKWYKITNGARVQVAVSVAPEEPFAFSKFTYTPYSKITGDEDDGYELYTDTERVSDISKSPSFELVATGAGVITCVYISNEPRTIRVTYADGSSSANGELSITPWPPYANPWTPTGGGKGGDYRPDQTVEISAVARNGYRFAGWYLDDELVSASPNYTMPLSPSSPLNLDYKAAFAEDSSGAYEWEGNANENLRMDWRSRRFTNPQPVNFVAGSVCADGYPTDDGKVTELTVHHASSPNAGDNDWRDANISVYDQDPRRLPMRRPERYIEVEVESNEPVLRLAVSTSMGNLISQ